MDLHGELLVWLAAWMAVACLILAAHWRRAPLLNVGLVMAYVVNLWMIHWVGPAVYLNSEPHLHDIADVLVGTKESLWALMALGFGSAVLGPLFIGRWGPGAGSLESLRRAPVDRRLAKLFLFLGGTGYVVLRIIGHDAATATAVASVGARLFVVGVCMLLWQAWLDKRWSSFGGWFFLASLLPYVTTISQGHIGYGSMVFIVVMTFALAFLRPRWKLVVALPLAIYLGLSIFVSYSRVRDDIRTVVWGGKPLSDRVEVLYAATIGIEWFDPGNIEHLDPLDRRLNQSYLVGRSVNYLTSNGNYAYGDTLWDSVLSLVPRFLWPGKNVFAGSGDLAARFTGDQFSTTSSTGIGHVMEFYVNFGTVGVVGGFVLLGLALALVDAAAAVRVRSGRWESFALWMLVGMSMLHVGGSLVDLTGSIGTAIVIGFVVNHFISPARRRPFSASSGGTDAAASGWI